MFPRASKTPRLAPPSRNVSAFSLSSHFPAFANVYRSLLCIIKTLEQIFILFAIQLDRQFPGGLRKYLLYRGTSLVLSHPWPFSSLSRNYLARGCIPCRGNARGRVLATIYLSHRCCFIILNSNLYFMQQQTPRGSSRGTI